MSEQSEATSMRLVSVTGKCPHCDVEKHQIDTSQEHAIEVLTAAFDRHIRDEHSEATPPTTDRPADGDLGEGEEG